MFVYFLSWLRILLGVLFFLIAMKCWSFVLRALEGIGRKLAFSVLGMNLEPMSLGHFGCGALHNGECLKSRLLFV